MATTTEQQQPTDVDVLVVGAGISGIGMGCHLATRLPDRSYAILEAREAIGGTWDLFRYPGIRSDSDLHTFGYAFKPWTSPNMIAEADEILDYLREAAEEHGVLDHVRLGHRVLSAAWSTEDARWTVRAEHGGQVVELTARWLFSATGYYDYAGGFRPRFEGEEDFAGRIVHPQEWPHDLDHAGKRVVVIGSGATAVTLIPAMADETAHITMLQRSPSYIATVPKRNHVATALARVLPGQQAHDVVRKVNIRVWRAMYETCQKHPVRMRRVIRAMTKLQLPKGYPVDVDFNPTYDPWDQRLCAVPDGDLFKAIKAGRASVVTDRIARFTERGILLESGRELEADIIVTATGLNMLAFGHVELSVDGVPIVPSETVAFKSMLVSGVPNFAFALGYTNISWTLKVDLVCEHLCRLVADVEARGKDYVIPVLDEPGMERLPLLDFAAGYVQRGVAGFPRRGTRGPWTVEQDYLADVRRLREGPVTDPALRYGTAVREPALT